MNNIVKIELNVNYSDYERVARQRIANLELNIEKYKEELRENNLCIEEEQGIIQSIKDCNIEIDMLSKFIPISVIYKSDDDIKYHVGRCPKCEQLNTELYGMDICTKCGQALKWSN